MQKTISIRVSPAEAANPLLLQEKILQNCGVKAASFNGFNILRKSIDARKQEIFINLSLQVFIDEPYTFVSKPSFQFREVHHAEKKAVIIGAGPAGLFAAIKLIEAGIKPIILERGKNVKDRRRDLAALNKSGIINPDSNYCFGEGGAGTYSDGKLYTRSNKRGDIHRILHLFVTFGADEKILYEAHPHIGTNKLPQIISAMRDKIIECGGEVHFNTKVTDFNLKDGKIRSACCGNGTQFEGDHFILATGHSARDIFRLLHKKNILIEAKPFALGVRVEHPQSLIDRIQYHCPTRSEFLPPASYSLVDQIDDRGVFSFCMCPGGIIATASTDPEELVVNGWSPSKRNNPFANSGMVVQIDRESALHTLSDLKLSPEDPLLFLYFQEMVEKKAYKAGGGNFVAPAQRLVDFCERRNSSSLPESSYIPGLNAAGLENVLPPFVYQTLKGGLKSFGKKLKGYYTNEAVLVATESRTSSPVRIPRDPTTGLHPQLSNFYPCGEGAGYAGGIVSAAMDGERVADWIRSVQ